MSDQLSTKDQIRQFRAILSSLGIQDMKDELVLQASSLRTTHASELTTEEMQSLINELNAKQKTVDNHSNPIDKGDKMRKRILSMCHQLIWTVWNEEKNKYVVDFKRLNEWMEKTSYLHKELDLYTKQELPKLVHQFETMFKNYLEKV